MVSTPKSPNTSSTSNDSNSSKVNIMSPYHQDFSQYIDLASTESPQVKSGEFDPASILYDYEVLMGNDIFHAETPIYDFSPVMSSSMTTPSLVLDGISTPQDLNDSPLFNNTSSFAASPSLEPPIGFFPDLTADPTASAAAAARRSYMLSIAPSVTIPVDDSSPISIPGNSNPSSALNIPWNPEATGSSSTDDLVQNASTSSPLMSNYSDNTADDTGNNTANNSPKSSSTAASSPSMPSLSKLTTRNRKRSNGDVDKDPQIMADELALKRAKNTDAARRSRLRRVMKMESLEKQVSELKGENNDLQTRIAVLESEKKGLEDKNAEKDARVKLLEQQLAEAHERLIKRTSIL